MNDADRLASGIRQALIILGLPGPELPAAADAEMTMAISELRDALGVHPDLRPDETEISVEQGTEGGILHITATATHLPSAITATVTVWDRDGTEHPDMLERRARSNAHLSLRERIGWASIEHALRRDGWTLLSCLLAGYYAVEEADSFPGDPRLPERYAVMRDDGCDWADIVEVYRADIHAELRSAV